MASSDPPNGSFASKIATDLFVGSLAGAAGILVGHPFDTIRVRLQTSHRGLYSGALDCTKKMIKNESVMSLFKGVSAPIVGVGVQNSILFAVYGGFKNLFSRYNESRGLEQSPTLLQYYACGMAAGTANLLVTTPVELVKVRLQTSTDKAKRSSIAELRNIIQVEGIKGCFRGLTMTMMRDTPSYGIYFAFYEHGIVSWRSATQALGMDGMFSMAVADTIVGGMAGVVSWASIYPFDVVKSRIQASPLDASKNKPSSWRFAFTIFQNEGIGAFFRGIHLCLLRAFPVNAATFFVYGFMTRLIEDMK